eukprot:scaffold4328_cov135-Isochrysis_galbana.AAC.13
MVAKASASNLRTLRLSASLLVPQHSPPTHPIPRHVPLHDTELTLTLALHNVRQHTRLDERRTVLLSLRKPDRSPPFWLSRLILPVPTTAEHKGARRRLGDGRHSCRTQCLGHGGARRRTNASGTRPFFRNAAIWAGGALRAGNGCGDGRHR